MSSFLFGDELNNNKEVEKVTKSHKLSNKVTPKQRTEPYKSHLVEVRVVVTALARVPVVVEPL